MTLASTIMLVRDEGKSPGFYPDNPLFRLSFDADEDNPAGFEWEIAPVYPKPGYPEGAGLIMVGTEMTEWRWDPKALGVGITIHEVQGTPYAARVRLRGGVWSEFVREKS